MNVQLLELVIWPLNSEKEKRVIKFSPGKLNIIHGASQTGKSAIVPIIDYCLCSSRNNIPVGVIREKSSWFGIKLQIDNNVMIFARENKDGGSGKLYFNYDKDAEFPHIPFVNETDTNGLKAKVNNILGIPFFEIDEEIYRPSFRDLVAFNFQPQNIIANPNCLLYKSDISKYRLRLRNIFNFAIGVETAETLGKKQLKILYEQELEILRKEKKEKQEFIFNETMKQQDLILKAIGYGLLKKDEVILNDQQSILYNLEKLTNMSFSELSLTSLGNEMIVTKFIELDNKLQPLYTELRELQKKYNSIKEFVELEQKYLNNMKVKRQRLNLALFIREFCLTNVQDCSIIEDLDLICNKIEVLETEIRKNTPSKNSRYERELIKTDQKILEINEKINSLIKQYNNLKDINNKKSLLENFLIDIGRAKNIINLLKVDYSELDKKIIEKENEIKKNETNIDAKPVIKKILTKIEKYVPNAAEFKKIADFDTTDLTLKLWTDNDGIAYLSETGSGSNWVAYHLAAVLGFQEYFIQQNSFVFNFLVLDQPSQVYFPSAKLDKSTGMYLLEEGEDVLHVRNMYKIMNEAIEHNNSKLQIIVMDHAGKNIWENCSNKNEVAYWTKQNALIPSDW